MGHQWFIWSALAKASELIVIVARDATVERIKARKPRNTEDSRLRRVKLELDFSNRAKARLGRSDANFWQTITEEAPDMILLGYDQHIKEVQITEKFPHIKVERCDEYQPEWFKSSKF